MLDRIGVDMVLNTFCNLKIACFTGIKASVGLVVYLNYGYIQHIVLNVTVG